MAGARYPRELLERAIALVEDELRAGARPPNVYAPGTRSAIQAASVRAVEEKICNSRQVFHHIVTVAKDREGLEPDWSAFRPRQYLVTPPGAPVIPPEDHLVEDDPEGPLIRVAVIGDAHDAPHLPDKSRFRWLGAYVEEHGFERVVSVGDWMSMDSFSTHTDRATFEGLAKPTFEQDLESFHESQKAFQDGLGGHKPKKDITLGNHELRAWRWANQNPEIVGRMVDPGKKTDEAFMQWGWRTTPYGQYRFIGGVGFVHCPLNAMGKPMGGVTGGQRAAAAAMFDIIRGDDHKSTRSVADKLGPVRAPEVYSAATALPPGFIEGYANKGGSTWRSGICEAHLWGGHVRRWCFEEMVLLRKRYGRSGEGAPKTRLGWRSAA